MQPEVVEKNQTEATLEGNNINITDDEADMLLKKTIVIKEENPTEYLNKYGISPLNKAKNVFETPDLSPTTLKKLLNDKNKSTVKLPNLPLRAHMSSTYSKNYPLPP